MEGASFQPASTLPSKEQVVSVRAWIEGLDQRKGDEMHVTISVSTCHVNRVPQSFPLSMTEGTHISKVTRPA